MNFEFLNYFPKYSKWIFIFLFLSISLIYNYQTILFLPPQSIHTWRQCDCLSITKNYFEDNNTFFQPSVHNLGSDGSGKAVSDFPIIHYIVAQLWKIFGEHEFIYRLLILLIFYIGLFTLFKIFEDFFKDSVIAILFSLFIFTSPTIVYYANNYLMEIPSLSIAIIGFSFFLKFVNSQKNKYLYLFSILYAIAGLLKISSLLSFVAICSVYILEIFNYTFSEKKIFQNPKVQSIPLLLVFIIQMIWYLYANSYNQTHNSGFFLIGILPIWKLDFSQTSIVLSAISEQIKWNYFRKETIVLFALMFLFVLIFYKKVNRLILLITIEVTIGFFLFLLLFFQALEQHDYYVINLFIIIPLIAIIFLNLLKNRFYNIYSSVIFRIIILLFLIHNIDFARRRINSRYDVDGWQNKYYITQLQKYENMQPYLSTIGIENNDTIICLSDNSTNISLYKLNMKGWTNFNSLNDSIKIKAKIKMGAKYIFIENQDILNFESIQPFLKNKVGEIKNMSIYKL